MAIQMAETQLYSLEVWAHTLDLGTMTHTEMPKAPIPPVIWPHAPVIMALGSFSDLLCGNHPLTWSGQQVLRCKP